MAKSLYFPLIAVVCYAVANVVLEQKLSKYNNLSLLVVYAGLIFVLAAVLRQFMRTADPVWDFPAGAAMLLMIAVALVFFAADYFYLGAYTNGGDVLTITMIMTLLPVVASVVKFLWVGGLPNKWQLAAYACAIAAVALAAKGSPPPS